MNDAMAHTRPVFVGVDIGASRTKVAVLDSTRKLLGHAVTRSGSDFVAAAEDCLTASLAMARSSREAIGCAVSTGYGRKNATFAAANRTEISCHGRGCFHCFPFQISIIDIGGQDNKIIRLDGAGRRTGFKMNRKCAAGTGAFLEEMSARLNVPLEEMDGLARQSRSPVELGSYCTVFTATEVLEKIRQGKPLPDIIGGLFLSVIKRILEMEPLTGHIVMTGGVVAHNPFLVTMAEQILGRKLLVPEHPQLTGAIGAALYAVEAGVDA
ncbi:MAG: acyl-CoA dehydratase activase [Thermodesulfobacteriota bacterium]